MIFGIIMVYLVFSTGKPQWLVRLVEGKQSRIVGGQNNKRIEEPKKSIFYNFFSSYVIE